MYKLKRWTMKVLDWGAPVPQDVCREETLESALQDLQQCRLDPRELPRPHRYHGNCGSKSQSPAESEDEAATSCCCRNCSHLANQLFECAICLEPLSSVTSCIECGNIACVCCAARLQRCPYCRTSNGLVPNIALQRLICKLDKPHRNSVRCPHKKCEWRGEDDDLSSHLEQTHLVTILNGSSVTLEIAKFQRKAELSETRPRYYSVLLACFSDVFVCKVTLQHGKLKVALTQLTHAKQTQLAAWVEISCASKTMKGIIPLSKNKSDIEVPVTNFVAPACGNGDRVSISVSIRPLS